MVGRVETLVSMGDPWFEIFEIARASTHRLLHVGTKLYRKTGLMKSSEIDWASKEQFQIKKTFLHPRGCAGSGSRQDFRNVVETKLLGVRYETDRYDETFDHSTLR